MNIIIGLLLLLVTAFVACNTEPQPTGLSSSESTSPTPSVSDQPVQSKTNAQVYGYTHVRADGNRLASGIGTLSANRLPIDIDLPGKPIWVVGVPHRDGISWGVVLSDGKAVTVSTSASEDFPVSPSFPFVGIPIMASGDEPAILNESESSPISHPVPIGDSGRIAFINQEGELVVRDNDSIVATLPVDALPDARILVDESQRLLFLSGPTERYPHGIAGDRVEASSITIVQTTPRIEVQRRIEVSGDLVIEGISPIWSDINGDGDREIIVTVSNSSQGAQIIAFSDDGTQIAASDPIGQGSRWRHQIAVAPFGPNGETELVDVRTPHIGGIIEFFRLVDDRLEIVARLRGYTSHVIRSRNLDMAASGDFDGDGQIELLLPNQALTELGAIRRNSSEEGVEVAWTLPIGGRLSTNIGVVPLADEGIAVAVGRDDGTLRLWLP